MIRGCYRILIMLPSINETDAGSYICSATNGSTSWQAEATIIVTVSAIITVVPNSQTVIEGEDVTINCNVFMNSTNLNLTWSKVDDQRLLSHSNQLMLPNINETDAGSYICFATNGSTSWQAVATIIVTASPVISAKPKSQTVVEGDDVTVKCKISGNATKVNFTWNRVGYPGILSNVGQLSLPDINRSQEGSYNCSVTNETNQWTAVAKIIVNYPVQILHITANQTVNESSTTAFSCNVSGSPTPNIMWSFPNGSKISLHGNGSLVITNISRTGNGKYMCNANNGIGGATSASTFLNVQYKPTVKSWHKEPLTPRLFHNSTLNCSGDANPVPEITWSKDGRTLKKDNKFVSIVVSPRKKDDFGSYVCTAENPLGKSRVVVEVNRLAFPPSAPEIGNNETTLQSRSFLLHWSEPSSNGRPILRYVIWLRNISQKSSIPQKSWNRATVAGNITVYTLNLDWGASYQVAVTAENDQGSSEKNIKNFTVVPEPTTETHAPPSPSAFIFGVVGGVTAFLVIFIICIVYSICKRRTKRGDIQRRTAPVDGKSPLCSVAMKDLSRTNLKSVVTTREEKSLYVTEHPIYVNASFCNDAKADWEFPREKLHIQKEIGKGAFCVVARAFAEGLGTVAVKMPKEMALESNKKDLLEEYYLLRQIERHPNIIRLMGAVTCSDPVMVMFEYIPYGDLLGYLRRSRGLHDNYYKDPDVQPTSSLTSEQLLRFAREIADGMAFISSNKIIHRDLAARNVLVGEGEICKITDFGMARDVQLNEIYQKRTKGRLPVKWTAYESLLYGFSTTQSDVWSYGIVLYEIFTIGGCPYPNVKSHEVPYKIQNGYRMPKPAHLDKDIYALMSECWKTEPELRPTFDSISKTIKRLERSHRNIIYMNVYDERLYGNVGDWD